jgi:hypothetical protein
MKKKYCKILIFCTLSQQIQRISLQITMGLDVHYVFSNVCICFFNIDSGPPARPLLLLSVTKFTNILGQCAVVEFCYILPTCINRKSSRLSYSINTKLSTSFTQTFYEYLHSTTIIHSFYPFPHFKHLLKNMVSLPEKDLVYN